MGFAFVRSKESNCLLCPPLPQSVLAGCANPNQQVRSASLDCLVDVAEKYYEFMLPYMAKCLEVTKANIEGTDEDCTLLGIAFSCNIGGMTTPIASPQNVIALIALRTNAPTVLRKEALSYTTADGVSVLGSNVKVQPEKAILANGSAVREWDSNGTNFGCATRSRPGICGSGPHLQRRRRHDSSPASRSCETSHRPASHESAGP